MKQSCLGIVQKGMLAHNTTHICTTTNLVFAPGWRAALSRMGEQKRRQNAEFVY